MFGDDVRDYLRLIWRQNVRTDRVIEDTTYSTRREAEQILAVRTVHIIVDTSLNILMYSGGGKISIVEETNIHFRTTQTNLVSSCCEHIVSDSPWIQLITKVMEDLKKMNDFRVLKHLQTWCVHIKFFLYLTLLLQWIIFFECLIRIII